MEKHYSLSLQQLSLAIVQTLHYESDHNNYCNQELVDNLWR